MNDIIIGKHVKCILRNSVVLEGIADEWSDSRVVLKSLDGESFMIVHKPTEDILMTKVFMNDLPEKKTVEPSEMQERIKDKLHEAQQTIDDPELQQKSIGELRQLVVDQEKQMIAQKRREHFGSAGAAKMTHYSNPITRPHPRSNTARSAYQPGKLPNWVRSNPPREK